MAVDLKHRAFISGVEGWPDATVADDRWYLSDTYYFAPLIDVSIDTVDVVSITDIVISSLGVLVVVLSDDVSIVDVSGAEVTKVDISVIDATTVTEDVVVKLALDLVINIVDSISISDIVDSTVEDCILVVEDSVALAEDKKAIGAVRQSQAIV